MWVVKLGGSLAHTSALPRWLAVIAEEGRGRALVVPGGGPFADQVRRAQARWGFADPVAHRMALLAMEQYGLMLCGLRAGLVPASSREGVRRALAQGATPVWMPSALALAECELPQSWMTTSDSLAAWLTLQLAASHLVLVKSVQLHGGRASAHSLRELGIVDRAFPRLIERGRFATLLFGRGEEQGFRQLLRGAPGGTVVTAA